MRSRRTDLVSSAFIAAFSFSSRLPERKNSWCVRTSSSNWSGSPSSLSHIAAWSAVKVAYASSTSSSQLSMSAGRGPSR